MSGREPEDPPSGPEGAWLGDARASLLSHYDRSARSLPWRGETDPYRIWVSEVMLQQTRVETVVPYYRAWLERFPDLEALAAAGVDDVLVRWQGLGYYRRARNLHVGAAFVRERFGGRLPETEEELRCIPGIGEYTAGAVASIAFGRVTPAVDGNVRRVLARLFDEPEPKASWLRARAGSLVDPDRPGDWNQALMELGATLCTPRTPRCAACPLSEWCASRAAGTQAERPRRRAKPSVPTTTYAVAVVVDGRGQALVHRRPDDGLLAGMWSFPEGEVSTGGRGVGEYVAAARAAVNGSGASVRESGARVLEEVQHRFTHLAARYVPVLLEGRGQESADTRWVDLEAPEGLALPAAQRRIAGVAWTAWNENRKESSADADP